MRRFIESIRASWIEFKVIRELRRQDKMGNIPMDITRLPKSFNKVIWKDDN